MIDNSFFSAVPVFAFLCLQKPDKEPQSSFDPAVSHSVKAAVGGITLGLGLTSDILENIILLVHLF